MNRKYNSILTLIVASSLALVGYGGGEPAQRTDSVKDQSKTLKIFILAGDDNMIEQGISGAVDQKTKKELPGTLTDLLSKEPRFSFLKDKDGAWAERQDVFLYDSHPNFNNTVSPASPLKVGGIGYGGKKPSSNIGPELMFGHTVGNALDEQVLLIRYAIGHQMSSRRGSCSLYQDFRSPSRGGGEDNDGGWDVIHFNFGVWDTYRFGTDENGKRTGFDRENGKILVPIDRYESNLREIVKKLKATGATLIWGSTTPVHKDCPTTYAEDVIRYNEVAAKIMQENGVIINDLHAETLRQGRPQGTDVHDTGKLAPIVTKAIKDAIKAREKNSKPLPRVLIIGDSISGKYTRDILGAKEFEGMASLYQIPGNGESSDTGVKKIDTWLDLKTYRLNGQSYMEMIHGIKFVLNDPKRIYPGYKNEKIEIAGFVWFQGILDSGAAVMVKEYEANLVSLIGDVRRDLASPNLPAVIIALPNQNGAIHLAQMALADPAKHPEFQGNLTVIDSTPFFREKEISPGSPNTTKGRLRYIHHSQCYNGNAESFLLIGEAAGKEILKLRDTN